MPRAITISTKVSGPFFELQGEPLKDAMRATIHDLIREGEAKVEQQLYPGHGVRTGEFKSTIHDRIVHSALGVVLSDNSVKGKVLERGRYWSSTGHRFKGYAMFRKAAQHLRKIANEIAGKHYKRAVKRLT